MVSPTPLVPQIHPTHPLSSFRRSSTPSSTRSTQQRMAREAKLVSDRIDQQIRSEKQANLRNRAPVNVLRLGQAESGAPPFILLVYLYANSIHFHTHTSLYPGKSTTVISFPRLLCRCVPNPTRTLPLTQYGPNGVRVVCWYRKGCPAPPLANLLSVQYAQVCPVLFSSTSPKTLSRTFL